MRLTVPDEGFTQAGFAAALFKAQPAVPPGLAAGTPAHRFEVYRRNVQAGLARALEARFPVVHALVGAEFFMAMAREFVTRQLPTSPVLLEYGRAMPDFIRGFAPAASVPYLADVAALEVSRGEAWHAQSLPVAAPADLQRRCLTEARLLLQPALGLVRSPFPVLAIWEHHHRHHRADAPPIDWQPQSVAVHRQGGEVVQEALAPPEAAFLAALLAGETLGAAFHSARHTAAGFDATAAFVWLLARDLVGAVEPGIHQQGEQDDATDR